jgi:hypothetical protein
MRSKVLGYVIALTAGFALSTVARAEPKNRGKASASDGDKSIDKQMEWEKKVMGDDGGKAAEMRKIAAAQKIADEAAKRPPPIQAPKVKDPNKEGVRAKQEAAIGLPIASDQETHTPTPRKGGGNSKKAAEPKSSANDELGALVASSLAEDKAPDSHARATRDRASQARAGQTSAGARGAKGKGRTRAPSAPNSLDQMFATSK